MMGPSKGPFSSTILSIVGDSNTENIDIYPNFGMHLYFASYFSIPVLYLRSSHSEPCPA